MNGNISYPAETFLSDEEVSVLKRTLLDGYTEAEQESFVRLCQRTLLDPFSKQIYATRRWVKDRSSGNKRPTLVPVTSVVGLTAIAARTGHYDGCILSWAGKDGVWREEWLEDEFPSAAKCVVFHKQRSHPEVGIARWNAYCGQTYNDSTKRWEVSDFWERLSDFMLGKCAKAQALRGAFPDQCSNLYIAEELQGNISEADQVNDEVKISENRRKEEQLLKEAASKGIKVVESKPVKKPTPAEAAAPAPEPPAPAAKPQEAPPAAPAAAPAPEPAKPVQGQVPADEPPDDLDMSPSESPAEQAEPPRESAKPWADHVIQGLKNPKFFERKVGELSITELQAIEAQWLPKVRQVWDQVNSLQKADAEAFESALAFSKMEKPWG